jgi:hypothetical protein
LEGCGPRAEALERGFGRIAFFRYEAYILKFIKI